MHYLVDVRKPSYCSELDSKRDKSLDYITGVCRYALDMQQKILEPLSPMTQSSLLSFAELFSFMMSEGGRSRGQVRIKTIRKLKMMVLPRCLLPTSEEGREQRRICRSTRI